MSLQENEINLTDAKRFAAKWRQVEGTYNAHHELHAFVIPTVDLQELLAENPSAVRAYLGVDDLGEEKLMFVGTTYNEETDTYVDNVPLSKVSDGIYDFSRPCPNLCDKESPLN